MALQENPQPPRTLEDEIPFLNELDQIRHEAKELLRRGEEAIAGIEGDLVEGWDGSGDAVEAAQLILAQKPGGTGSFLFNRLADLSLPKLFSDEPRDVPVFGAALAMQALVKKSEHAFSAATFRCYYRIIRELYAVHAPDWVVGGARAGNGGKATAFISSHCVRAISSFAQTLDRTACYFKSSADLLESLARLGRLKRLEQWQAQETQRLVDDWRAKTHVGQGEIALNLAARLHIEASTSGDHIDCYYELLEKELPKTIRRARDNFKRALEDVNRYHRSEASSDQRGVQRVGNEGPHATGVGIIQNAIDRANQATQILDSRVSFAEALKQLGALFALIARDVRRVLEPAGRFVATVLDRELTVASADSDMNLDMPELIFAAAAYGAMHDDWQDERMLRACDLFAAKLSPGGEVAAGRPFSATPFGFRLHPIGFEVARGYAQLVAKAKQPRDLQVARRLLALFRNYQVTEPGVKGGGRFGWRFEASAARRPSTWSSAAAVLALRQYISMIDSLINGTVLSHFDVGRARDCKLDLPQLLYPDAGLSGAPQDCAPMQSSSDLLANMRKHVLDVGMSEAVREAKVPKKSVFSALLYGPPGTGKTSLIEALAKNCDVPVLRIGPGDIAVGGEEAIERRARAIFTSLAMLTGAIIIFDEFEPVLFKRNRDGKGEQANTFVFLTPGMLPKLTKLHDRAKEQRLAYCLVTNHYEKLDDAAIRKGRFDEHLQILPPDPIARAGYLANLLLKRKLDYFDDERWMRLLKVVKMTAGCQVDFLAGRLFSDELVGKFVESGEGEEKLKLEIAREKHSAPAQDEENKLWRWLWEDLEEHAFEKR